MNTVDFVKNIKEWFISNLNLEVNVNIGDENYDNVVYININQEVDIELNKIKEMVDYLTSKGMVMGMIHQEPDEDVDEKVKTIEITKHYYCGGFEDKTTENTWTNITLYYHLEFE